MIITALEFFVVFLLIVVIVYPDRALVLVPGRSRSGTTHGWLSVLMVELVAVPLLVYAMTFLPALYRHLGKFYPLIYLVALALFRLFCRVATSVFGSDD